MKFVLDAFGGDNSPREIVRGAVTAVNLLDDVEIILTGDKSRIQNELDEIGYAGSKIEIVHAPEIISNDEVPTMAIRKKTGSSLIAGLELLAKDKSVSGLISAGNTGAILAGGLLKVGRIEGVLRPALAPLLPNALGGQSLLIDCGANTDCKPEYLVQFAVMGSIYLKSIFGIKNPRVALLSVGTEDRKGNELTRAVFEKLSKMKDINFVGNMESRDLLSGNYDVMVADGFIGNVALKSSEGATMYLMHTIKETIKKGNINAKIGAMFLKKTFKDIKSKLDYNNFGGSPFLGTKKLIIKSHGSSTAKTIYFCVLQARKLVMAKTIEKIKKRLESVAVEGK